MAIFDGVRIIESTTTTGTGTLSLAGALSGYNSFVSQIGSGNQAVYFLHDANGAWEVGIGTITDGAPDTLSRDTVLKSSNANSLVNLSSGTHTVANTPIPGYATGNSNFLDLILQRPEIKDYAESVATPSISSGTLTLDLELGNVFDVSHNANITTLTLSNPPASGKCGSFTLILTQDATGGRTLAMPASFKWPSAAAPTLSTVANKDNILEGFTLNGGTTWRCWLAGKEFG